MTDKEYLKRMIAITDELERIANHEPLLQDSWDMYMNEMHMVTSDWHASRRRQPTFFLFFCCLLAIMLGLVIISISC